MPLVEWPTSTRQSGNRAFHSRSLRLAQFIGFRRNIWLSINMTRSPSAPRQCIRRLKLPILGSWRSHFPLAEECAIAHILGKIENTIDLFRRMDATLEAMGGSVSRDWFVDYSPARAKASGRAL